jgi:hypothetical protein
MRIDLKVSGGSYAGIEWFACYLTRMNHRIVSWSARARSEVSPMVEKTTNLDDHRGMMAQRATELRRLRAEVEADQAALRARQQELETLLAAAPASNWAEAVEKARYLINLFSQTAESDDRQRQLLIDRVKADFDFLLGESDQVET